MVNQVIGILMPTGLWISNTIKILITPGFFSKAEKLLDTACRNARSSNVSEIP